MRSTVVDALTRHVIFAKRLPGKGLHRNRRVRTRARPAFASGAAMLRTWIIPGHLLVALLTLAACGGGAGGGPAPSPEPSPAIVLPASVLPDASTAAWFGPHALPIQVEEGLEARFALIGGHLPHGVSLDDTGHLAGQPTEQGDFAFEVRAFAGDATATQRYVLGVDAFSVRGTGGLVADQAWVGVEVMAIVGGAEGGATLIAIEGPVAQVSLDGQLLRLTPTGEGRIAVTLRRSSDQRDTTWEVDAIADPTRHRIAELGTADVWYVDFDHRHGGHGHASDFHAALAQMGLRDPDARDARGSEADRLAAYLVKREVHKNLNRMFLREEDGSAGAEGLSICFPWASPGGFQAPAAGHWLDGRADRMNVMALAWQGRPMVIGTALLDLVGNPYVENDAPSAAGDYGVFLETFTAYFNSRQMNIDLPDAPIAPGDRDELARIVRGESPYTGRGILIRNVVERLGHDLAAVLAHEIAHGCGLTHTDPEVPGSLMNGRAQFASPNMLGFTATDVARLRAALPGPGRYEFDDAQKIRLAFARAGTCTCTLK